MILANMSDLEQQIRRLVDDGSISDRDAIRLILASQAEILAAMRMMQQSLEERRMAVDRRMILLEQQMAEFEHYMREYPSITWLLRHRTKETITFIVLVFVLLSLWFVSGFRQPILDWLGLPIF
jgi:hypothetical protein